MHDSTSTTQREECTIRNVGTDDNARMCISILIAFFTMLHLRVLRDHILYIIHNIKLEN